MVAQTVIGIQGAGVITSTKHYIGNEQETNRMPVQQAQSVSSNIDDQTMHEVYLWFAFPFFPPLHSFLLGCN